MSAQPDRKDLAKITHFVATLLERAGFKTTLEHRVEDDKLFIEILGPDAAALITKTGGARTPEFIDAVATLARNILGPNGPSTVIVDAAGYRANRSDDLEKLAQTIAQKTAQGHQLDVYGMNNVDRRAIHRHLGAFDTVSTQSSGYGIFRRLQIRKA